MAEITHIVVSCEHGGNRVPRRYRQLFESAEALLASHRGHDPGALHLARVIASELDAELHYSTITRLLVELNRSVHNHRSIFSSISRRFPAGEKRRILEQYYLPYRQGIEQRLRELAAAGHLVLHLSVHSFTPELDGNVRNADIGFLYDPTRTLEKAFCHNWRRQLKKTGLETAVKMNYPYLGTSDGLTTHLRKVFDGSFYLGIELEVNQRHIASNGVFAKRLVEAISESLCAVTATPL